MLPCMDPGGSPNPNDMQALLAQAAGGDKEALSAVFPMIYDELRRIAAARMQHERPGHTLTPTAVVHELYARIVKTPAVIAEDRVHFMAIAAKLIRQVLVDHARGKDRLKRGGDAAKVPLDTSLLIPERPGCEVVEIDEALARLAKLSPRQASVVELRFFGGLTSEETAAHLGVSLRTVEADWSMARTWLRCELAR